MTNEFVCYIIAFVEWKATHTQVGVFSDEGPPVPIPNTEVKLISADNTWLEAAREDKAMPTHYHSKGCGFFIFILLSAIDISLVNII